VSRLTDLIAQAKANDPQIGADLEREFKILSPRLPLGLNFERHRPEAVELPQRPIRKGDKVFHTVINGENYHVLKALTYTHASRQDRRHLHRSAVQLRREGLESEVRHFGFARCR
jgi:hypothetical protein